LELVKYYDRHTKRLNLSGPPGDTDEGNGRVTPLSAVIPAKAGIQYSRASEGNRQRCGVLDARHRRAKRRRSSNGYARA
jgi:hypothetical protein